MRPIDADALKGDYVVTSTTTNSLCNLYVSMEQIAMAPTVKLASPWHRVEDGLPEMSEIVPGYVCSKTLVLYDAESGHMDIGYVREKPNGVDWIWGDPFKNPTHWMPIEPPKEDA
jgi:hypothetical protein